jgi:hypothetical protein
VEIEDTKLADNNGDYMYKYSSGELVLLTPAEMDVHPNKLAREINATKNLAIDAIVQAQKWGTLVKAEFSYRNLSKNLTLAQKKQLVVENASTIALLDSGSLSTAKAEIEATVADGILITEYDKAALIAKIDEYLGE